MKKKVVLIIGILVLMAITIPAQDFNMSEYETKGSPTLHLLIQDMNEMPSSYHQAMIILYFLSVRAGN